MKALDQIISLLLQDKGTAPIQNASLYLQSKSKGINYHKTIGKVSPKGPPLPPDHQFRIASISKIFTATLLLKYWERDLVELNQPFQHYLPKELQALCSGLLYKDGIDLSASITIQQLLEHRSGLADYFSDDPRFLQMVMEQPHQQWSVESILQSFKKLGLPQKGNSPNHRFHYADTNYLLIALLMEQISALPFHQVLREQILSPLGLNDTYLEFYEAPKDKLPFAPPFYGPQSLAKVNTSFDWGGGGLVSSMQDLHRFAEALFSGTLFQKVESLDWMQSFKEVNVGEEYGLGLQRLKVKGQYWLGHRSAYGAALFYQPDDQIHLILSLNQAMALPKAEFLLRKVIKTIS